MSYLEEALRQTQDMLETLYIQLACESFSVPLNKQEKVSGESDLRV